MRWTCDDLKGVKMHHMLVARETGPKRQLSFECCDSKNNSLLSLGKTTGVELDQEQEESRTRRI
jgi:hypothetical protein